MENLQTTETPKRGPGRPKRVIDEKAKQLAALVAHKRREDTDSGNPSLMTADVLAGVTVGWLSEIFGMDPSTVRAKLADCPPIHKRKAGYVYSLPVACRFLVRPANKDLGAYIAKMKPGELPNNLQKDYWDAQLKRQKWEENAGDLWRTDKVLEVLGETFKHIKFTIQLWADTLERATGLTQSQREMLTRLTDELQRDIYETLVKAATENRTPSTVSEVEDVEI